LFQHWDNLIGTLQIDKTILEVNWAKPGKEEGLKTLKSFLDDRIKVFHSKRNDPNENVLSNLSPWFHFGQISVARAVIEAKKSPHRVFYIIN
jgi:deoxyribodipyrimidine photo-lyase